MRRFVTAALVACALLLGGGSAFGDPADEGNCISTRDNGGAAGERVSSSAGATFGSAVADALGGGTIGATASAADCRRP